MKRDLISALAVAVLLGVGCGKQEPSPAAPPQEAAPAEPAPTAAEPQAPAVAPAAVTPPAEITKPEPPLPTPAPASADAAATSAVERAAQASQTLLPPLTQAASNRLAAAAAAATNQVQGLMQQAKGLLANEKYQAALGVVQQIYTNKLTTEQRQVVDNLKTQAQAALTKQAATNAASALGGLLRGK